MNQLKLDGQRALLESFVLADDTAHLLSLVGAREAVRAIWAGLVGKKTVTLETEAGESQAIRVETVPMRSMKLECGRSHLMLTSPSIALGAIIIARTPEELEDRTWAALQRRCLTPLHSTWRTWALGELDPNTLTCHGLLARNLSIPSDFAERVSNAVRWGLLCA